MANFDGPLASRRRPAAAHIDNTFLPEDLPIETQKIIDEIDELHRALSGQNFREISDVVDESDGHQNPTGIPGEPKT